MITVQFPVRVPRDIFKGVPEHVELKTLTVDTDDVYKAFEAAVEAGHDPNRNIRWFTTDTKEALV